MEFGDAAGINYAFVMADMPDRVVWDFKDSVLRAVAEDGDNLAHASRKLRNCKEVVLTAVAQDGRALKHASRRLRGNRTIVRTAVEQNPEALQYASKRWQRRIVVVNGRPMAAI